MRGGRGDRIFSIPPVDLLVVVLCRWWFTPPQKGGTGPPVNRGVPDPPSKGGYRRPDRALGAGPPPDETGAGLTCAKRKGPRVVQGPLCRWWPVLLLRSALGALGLAPRVPL